MRILGLSAFLDDPAAALLDDGRILAIAEEERWSRVKHGVASHSCISITTNELMSPLWDLQLRYFPHASIQACLDQAGLSAKDIDVIAVGFDLEAILGGRARYKRGFPGLPKQVSDGRLSAFRSYSTYLRKRFAVGKTRVVFVPHHTAHAAGALFSSPSRKASVMTMDGMGEFESASLSLFNGTELETLASNPLPHSMGRVYSSTTQFLGFRANQDEEKVMALAGWGQDRFSGAFERLIHLTSRGFRIDPRAFWSRECQMGFLNPSSLPAELGVTPRGQSGKDPMAPPYPDVARSLQEILFKVSSHLLEIAREASGYREVCLAGGVALNCENNGRLLADLPWIDSLWVQPQAGDSGVALGSAYWVHFQETGRRPQPMSHAYYGSTFRNREVEGRLKAWGLPFGRADDVAVEAAEEIARGKIVGWFQGRSESGPRALGARSILSRPDDPLLSKRINEKVKMRETWRPFAPTVLSIDSQHWFGSKIRSPFMTTALPVSDNGREALSGVIHVTGTTRPQILESGVNPRYERLLHALGRIRGDRAVLNTSFNGAGEPIVETPEEAIRDFYTMGLDVLFIGNLVLRKGAG